MPRSILKSLTFVPQSKPNSDPLIIKRESMVSRLDDQKKLSDRDLLPSHPG